MRTILELSALRCVPWTLVFLGLASPAGAQWCPARGPEELPAAVSHTAALAAPGEPGDRIEISGTVVDADGITPAAGVILYVYHTNRAGLYARDPAARGLEAQHGRLRGWLRTDSVGRYRFTSVRPGPYPGGREPAHVHMELLPPGGVACEIDPVEFTDDALLTPAVRRDRPGYGGSGIVTPRRRPDGSWIAVRDIRLWPAARADTMTLDTKATVIEWAGTKFGGRGRHAGIVRVAPGTVVLGGSALIAGTITIPLETVEVTDIPVWEPVPRSKLRAHLLDADFFDVRRFPRATLTLHRAERMAPSVLRVQASLTMRGVTRPIAFDAQLEAPPEAAVAATAYFRINRHHWGLSYRGSEAGNDLVDDDITFRIRIVARRARR